MRILVTGGSGFVGRNLTERLVRDGHDVTITSNGAEPSIPGVVKTLYYGLQGIDWDHVRDQETIIHLMANNDTLCRDASEMRRINVFGAIQLFAAAYLAGCRNFVYASSTAVYGSQPAPYIEGVTKEAPLNAYGESKLEFDKAAMRFAEENQVRVTGLRYCNIYGPGEDQKGRRMSMIGQMLRCTENQDHVSLFEFGEQRRDWVYVKDVVTANILAMDRKIGEYGEIYNIGSGKSCTFNEIVEAIGAASGKSIEVKYIPCPFQDSYQNHTECDITKAKKELGYNPEFLAESGIADYYNLFRKS